MKIVLASASPRRKELIKLISDDVLCVTSDVDETLPEGIESGYVPEFLACKKAAAVKDNYFDDLVIGADTVVIIGGEILGKPKNSANAKEMLKKLSGRTHKVITGCALFLKGKSMSFSVTSYVTFYELSESEIDDYVATGEPNDKAGAYAIQGKGALLCKEIEGDFHNIVGLPVAELSRKIKQFIEICK